MKKLVLRSAAHIEVSVSDGRLRIEAKDQALHAISLTPAQARALLMELPDLIIEAENDWQDSHVVEPFQTRSGL